MLADHTTDKPATTPATPATSAPSALQYLHDMDHFIAQARATIAAGGIAHWSATPVGLKLDPFPNPEQWLILTVGPLGVSLDCGRPGFGPEV